MYGNGGVHFRRGPLRPVDDPRKKRIAVIRQVQGKMVVNGGSGFGRGLYVEIADQVKRTEEGSQGEEAETDYARPEEIFHAKSMAFLGEKGKGVPASSKFGARRKFFFTPRFLIFIQKPPQLRIDTLKFGGSGLSRSINILPSGIVRNILTFRVKFFLDCFSKYYYVKVKEGKMLCHSRTSRVAR
jgi:hypothetical protein